MGSTAPSVEVLMSRHAVLAGLAMLAFAAPSYAKAPPPTAKPKPVRNAEQSNGWYGAIDLGLVKHDGSGKPSASGKATAKGTVPLVTHKKN